MISSRRSFLSGLGAILAAPAVVQVTSLMPLRATPLVSVNYNITMDEFVVTEANKIVGKISALEANRNGLLTIDMITREAVKLFKNSNAFIQQIDREYDKTSAAPKIGQTIRIRLPEDFKVQDATRLI